MSIRGTSAAQDGRYFAQEKKLLAKMTFPSCFEQRVDMSKVQREVISQWVTERITQLLGFEDDIVVAMAINLLEPKVDEKLDPKQLQMALTGFLEKQAGAFTEELWLLLLSAQSNPTGIPSAILDKKKQEMQIIAQEKDKLKKVLDTKKTKIQSRDGDRRGHKEEQKTVHKDERRSPPGRSERRRRSRSLRRHPSRRSRSLRRRRRSPSPRKRRRSRSLPRGRSRRERSRSPSVKRRRRRSPSRSPGRVRERRSARSGRSSRRESSRHPRRSPSSSSSKSRHRSSSSSRSSSPARRRSTKCRQKDSSDSGSDSD